MMRKYFASCGLLTVLTLMLIIHAVPVHAQNTQNFDITSFTADYYLNRDNKQVSTMKVDEVIVAEFPGYDQNHGILRAIPKTYKGNSLQLKVQSVADERGTPYAYTTSSQNDNEVLKIGDANRYVHGAMTYHIIYTLRGVTTFFDDHDELYWNVNGTQWKQPFGSVQARVHIPAAFATNLQNRTVCYTGTQGSTSQNCTVQRSDEATGKLVTVSTGALPIGGNLSVVLGFTKGTFLVDTQAVRMRQLRLAGAAFLALGLPLIVFIRMYRKWRAVGKDPKGRGVIVPQYVPPKDLTVLASDIVLHEKLRTQAISALIIELAVKKYIALYETTNDGGLLHRKSTDYELELLKPATGLSPEEQSVIAMFFGTSTAVGKRVKIADLKTKLYRQVAALGKTIPELLADQGYFRSDPNKAKGKYRGLGVGCMMVALFLGFSLHAVGMLLVSLLVGLALSGIIALLFALVMPARTDKGVETRDYLLGVAQYIKLAEAERLKYLQSPEGVRQYGQPNDPSSKIKLFEKLLPYAMIFGLEKDWAKQFQDIYSQPPDWYHGNWSTFNTIYLVNSLGNFGTASVASFAAPASSGSSGFGGGGFSGGGGGGGGGGGW